MRVTKTRLAKELRVTEAEIEAAMTRGLPYWPSMQQPNAFGIPPGPAFWLPSAERYFATPPAQREEKALYGEFSSRV